MSSGPRCWEGKHLFKASQMNLILNICPCPLNKPQWFFKAFYWAVEMNSAMKEFCPRQIKEMISRVCLWALHPVSRPAAVSEHHAAVCWTCSVTETRCRAETFVLSEHLWYFCLCVTTGCNRQPDILILQPLRRTDHRKRSSAWCIKSKLNQPWDAVRPFQILSQRLLLSHSHTQTYTHTHTQHSGKTN